jgi:hypothetical protein
MTEAQILEALLTWGLPELLKLGKSVLDLIERKANAATIANAAVAGADIAADIAERKKFGLP